MSDRSELEELFRAHGLETFKWLDPAEIVVAQWVRMKCMFGCSGFGRAAACPPNTPTIPECERFIRDYSTAAIFHFSQTLADQEKRRQWIRQINERLLGLERSVFLAGYHKAFLLFMGTCTICAECVASPEECRQPESARPTPEGLGVDVFATARRVGYPIEVLSDHSQPMNRYAFLLIE